MAQIPEQLSAWQKVAIDATIAYAQATLASAEQLLRLNLEAARAALEQQAQAARDLLSSEDPQELLNLRSRLAEASMQRTASYAQDVYELVSQTQAQLARLAEQQWSHVNERALQRESAGQQEVPGAEVAMAAVKSSLAASAAMMDNLDRATRQFADLSEASIRAVTANMVKRAQGRDAAAQLQGERP
jgi:phasin family protein